MGLVSPLPGIDDVVVFYELLDPVGDDFFEQFSHAVQ